MAAEKSARFETAKRKPVSNEAADRKTPLRKLASNKELLFSGIAVAIIGIVALLPGLFATHDPYGLDVASRFQKPGPAHLFGTDNFGRDIFSRTVYGLQISVLVGLGVAILSGLLGLLIGLYAGFYRVLDQLFMRISDGLIAFPSILLALAIMSMLGPSIGNLMLCLTAVITPNVARVVRSGVLVIREQTYVEAMHALGASGTRILWRHIAPNTMSVLIVQTTFIFVEVIIVEAALSFLGAGIPSPTPSLGNLLLDGKMYIFNSWWMTVFPGAALFTVALVFNLLGDGLRDYLDPHADSAGGKSGRK
ncbi:ABC transporter permease [Cohnella faecalis]|uniref:ABC transporter permease n=1 Tax=Cohnella faecalis TaxID=2315694 RepID=A0A398D1H8_9BACL|nr:ABC transporter permease [Cohnella faecalis]RIE05034.1 ABC transporter permease [Cohnella faecalis]